MGTDRDWEKWGAVDPYFGVVSDDRFRKSNLDQGARADFFASGERHVADLLARLGCRSPDEERWVPTSCLDFGCGTGRLLLPLAKRAASAVGVDVSPSMLAECSKNVQMFDVQNVTLVDSAAKTSGEFSLVHSYIVFQHIPWKRGRVLLQDLARRVSPGGCLAVHLFVSCQAPKALRALVKSRYALPPLQWIWNLGRRRPVFEPPMQLNVYDLAVIAEDLLQAGFAELTAWEVPTVPNFRSVYLVAWKHSAKAEPGVACGESF